MGRTSKGSPALSSKTIEGLGKDGKIEITDYLTNTSNSELKARREKKTALLSEDFLQDRFIKVLLMKRIVYKYWPVENHLSHAYERSMRLKFEHFKDTFSSSTWEVGKVYDLSNKRCFPCEVKEKDSEDKKELYYVEDSLYFVLCMRDSPKSNRYKIMIKDLSVFIQFTLNNKDIYCENIIKVAHYNIEKNRSTKVPKSLSFRLHKQHRFMLQHPDIRHAVPTHER